MIARSPSRFPIRASVCLVAVLLAASGCAGSSPGSAASIPNRSTSIAPEASGLASSSSSPASNPSSSSGSVPAGYLALEGSIRENAQLLITTPAGHHIYIDYWNDTGGPTPGPDDILLTTYDSTHWPIHPGDLHLNADFDRHFPGTMLMYAPGQIDRPDVKVVSIAANHVDGPPDGTDYIMVVDVEGFRIVAFGDCGQTSFTIDQLTAIGRPDIAISQIWNPRSFMDATNPIGLAQMKQVDPRLFIVSHRDFRTLQMAVATWPSFYHKGPMLISRAMLPESTTMVLLGPDADLDGTDLGIGPIYQTTTAPHASASASAG